jgi:hypothetical protein
VSPDFWMQSSIMAWSGFILVAAAFFILNRMYDRLVGNYRMVLYEQEQSIHLNKDLARVNKELLDIIKKAQQDSEEEADWWKK